MNTKIQNKPKYRSALGQIETLMDAAPGSAEESALERPKILEQIPRFLRSI